MMAGLFNLYSVSFQNASLWFTGASRTGQRTGRVWSRFCSTLGWRRSLRTWEICKRKAILSQAFETWRAFHTHCFVLHWTYWTLVAGFWILPYLFLFGCLQHWFLFHMDLGSVLLEALDWCSFTLLVNFPHDYIHHSSMQQRETLLFLFIADYLFFQPRTNLFVRSVVHEVSEAANCVRFVCLFVLF